MQRIFFLYSFLVLFSIPQILCQTGIEQTTATATTTGFIGTTGTTGTTGTSGTTGTGDTVYNVNLSTASSVSVSIPGTSSQVEITFPAVSGTAQYSLASKSDIGYSDPQGTGAPNSFAFVPGTSFFITIFDSQHVPITTGFIMQVSILVTDTSNKALYLFNTTSNQWTDASLTCNPTNVTASGNSITFDICHLTQFALYQSSSVVSPTGTTGAASAGSNTGLLAAVIIVPIVIVAVVIALVAWTLLRKSGQPDDVNGPNSVEMGTKRPTTTNKASSTTAQTVATPSKVAESSSESEEESEEESSEEESESEEKAGAKKDESESESEEKKDGKESSSESEESEESESESTSDSKK